MGDTALGRRSVMSYLIPSDGNLLLDVDLKSDDLGGGGPARGKVVRLDPDPVRITGISVDLNDG